ncbi:MAG: hypothetical protein HRU13_12485 [Phycisphaerales bacterium]|nr:hypothetical protein [Phycisphaerales bacterium]
MASVVASATRSQATLEAQLSAVIETRIGDWYVDIGREKDAKAAYERAVAHDTRSYEALSALAALAHERRDHDRAVELLAESIWAEPELFNASHYDDALGVAELLAPYRAPRARVGPGTLYARLRLASLHISDRSTSEARADLRAVQAIDPENTLALHLLASVSRGFDLEQSLELCTRVIEAEPGRARPYIERALTYIEMEDYEAARDDLGRSIGV